MVSSLGNGFVSASRLHPSAAPSETPEGDEFYWTRTVLQTHHAAETPGDSFEGSPRSRIFGHPDPRWPSLLETAPEVAAAIAAHNPRDAERVL